MESRVVWIGSYTSPKNGEGIVVCRQDPATGELIQVGASREVHNPSFLCLSPDRKTLFAVNEHGKSGEASSFEIGGDGLLGPVSKAASEGGAPCHLCTDPSGRFLFVANHNGGNVACLPIRAGGALEKASDVREHPGGNAHWVGFDPTGQVLLVCDKGNDRIMAYRLDSAAGKLRPHDPPSFELPEGCHPRHLAFHPNGHFAYVNGEADMTVSALAFDGERCDFSMLQRIGTLPEGASGKGWTTAEIAVHPSGKHLFVSNRGHDSLAVFAIGVDGRLSAAGHAAAPKNPRHFAIDPSGTRIYVAGQDSDTVERFKFDASTGRPERSGQAFRTGCPVCVVFAQVDF